MNLKKTKLFPLTQTGFRQYLTGGEKKDSGEKLSKSNP